MPGTKVRGSVRDACKLVTLLFALWKPPVWKKLPSK